MYTNRRFFEESGIPVIMMSGSGNKKKCLDEWNWKRKARVNLNGHIQYEAKLKCTDTSLNVKKD